MAEGRGLGRRRMVGDDGGYAARGSGFTAARERVSALCFRLVGRDLAAENRVWRRYHRPLRRRSRRRISAPGRRRAVPAELPGTAGEGWTGDPSGEDATAPETSGDPGLDASRRLIDGSADKENRKPSRFSGSPTIVVGTRRAILWSGGGQRQND